MNRPKQQHYVTRGYLEGFLRPGAEQLVCYGRGGRGPFSRTPENLASQRNYYALKKEKGAWDDSIEKLLATEVEGPGLPVVQKLASGKTRLTWDERARISLLMAFQEMRTPSARERVRAFSKALSDRILHEIKMGDPEQVSFEFTGRSGETGTATIDGVARAHEMICDDHSMDIHRPLMSAALKLSGHYRYMKFTICYANGSAEFITTDTPVIRTFSNAAVLGTGINRTDIEVRFPLSRRAFLTLTHDMRLNEILERANSAGQSRLLRRLPEIRVRNFKDAEVVMINRAHARHARRWLFAPSQIDWAVEVLALDPAAPKIVDLSSEDLINFQSSVSYDPEVDSLARSN
jgi:uncharacterized protein DUF4238